MKKTIIFIALLASVGGSLSAQDTLWQRPAPKSNYFTNYWIDTTIRYESSNFGFSYAFAIGRRFVTEDTLQVYGIAAMMVHGYAYSNYEDTTYENCEESLMLFQYRGNATPVMQQLGDSLPVHTLYTPVDYYFVSHTPPVYYSDTMMNPVYERYFSAPQTVTDTFYAAFTQNDCKFNKTNGLLYATRPNLRCTSFFPVDTPYLNSEEIAVWEQEDMDSSRYWRFLPNGSTIGAKFIFPILTPAPPVDTTVTPIDTTVTPIDTTVTPIDTTVTPIDTVTPGGDTLGVQTADLVGRYVSVMPNPARERAEVLSSFGLTKIELYDEQGRHLRTLPAAGLRATLDLRSLPPSTYLLRIHTPAGTTTKKLLVR